MKPTRLIPRFAPLVLALAVLAGAAHGAGAPDAGSAMVGEATLVIGVARVIAADGAIRAVERGSAIRVGDRIETGAGGHVHLRFVDGGRLSVRPASRLQIENYSHSEQQPALTAIKFRLDEGVVRSITGAWGEAARDRFRLNTPVAAIGVKGTDFIVRSDADNTLATVYTGAIVLTPLAGGCQASLGPCQNGREKLLSEDMKGQMLALSRLQASPQLVAATDLLAQRAQPAAADAGARAGQSLKVEAGRSDMAADKAAVSEARAVSVVAGQATEPAALPLAPPEVHQLMWARLAAVAADGDAVSRSFAEALQSGRQGTVGNGAYSLYRDAPGAGAAVLASADTAANFRLAGAAAELLRPEGRGTVSEAVRVDRGTLNVDFARSTYATQLNVSSSRIGAENVVSNGVIRPSGIFTSQGGNAYTAGALSLDGREAGYFFEKALATGQLRGITQWGR